MASTSELRRALARDGSARKVLAGVWGEWADNFCDELLLRLIVPVDNVKIHCWHRPDDSFQVNIDNKMTGAYTNDISCDPLATIGERLACKMVRDTDSAEAGDDS